MIHKKRKIALLSTFIVCAGLVGAVILHKTQSVDFPPSTLVQEVETPASILAPIEAAITEDVKETQEAEATLVAPATVAKQATSFNYTSSQEEGIIGVYAGKQLDNPADNIFTVKVDQTLSSKDKVFLTYELEGVADYTNIPRTINDRLAMGGYLIKKSEGTSIQREQINPTWLSRGDNRIQFSLPENADYGYKVSKLSIEVEKGANASALVVNSTATSFDNKVYVRGFLQDKTQNAKITIQDQEVALKDGEFETLLSLDADRKLEVKATLANGKELAETLHFTNGTSLDIEYAMNNHAQQVSKVFTKGLADDLALETALLKVDSAALLATKDLSITTLRHIDLPALDMGMSNITDSHKGYRFLPHGEHFAEGAKVAIKYDRTKLPSGYTEDDIRTYFFDTETKHWVALERDSVDKKNQLIVSTTTHFTDMINGVIQSPESPETQGFAPTMMNDIKAADPTAKVQLIAPPSANNRGSAGLSYGFEMPPARNGMSPSLGIQYNSDGGAGWLGEGWDLSTPSISVDTRWGVPRYNDAQETETYSMGGSMLATMDDAGESSVAHRGDKINRKSDRQFYPRNEGGFSKIIRKGNSLSNYTWEVTDKSGTKYTYGGDGAVLKGMAKTLTGADKEVVVEWKLSRVEELHGDWIAYEYETKEEDVRGSLKAKAIYLTAVKAGNKGEDPHTIVTLTSTSVKDKQPNSARHGFLTSNNKLLDKVEIAFEGEKLRTYTFTYKDGAFNTNILDKVTHLDSNDQEFASHSMDYYDDVRSGGNYMPFKANAETWKLPKHGLDAGFINPMTNLGVDGFSDEASALGGTKSTTNSVSGYVGVGLGLKPNKNLSAGVSYSHSKVNVEGVSTFIDINGDGLPDKVFKKGGNIYYSPNITQIGDRDVKFGTEIEIIGINDISKQSSRSNTWGPKAYAGMGIGAGNVSVSIGGDFNHTNNETSIYFADVNNDGLIDLVKNGQVYFNRIEKDANGNLVPTFKPSSGDTPSPIMGGGIIDDTDTQVDPQEQEELIKNSPLQDVVRVWEAPFSGKINISGNVQLQKPTGQYNIDEYAKADGVRVAIQVKGNERWNKPIAKDDETSYSTNLSGIDVSKGDRIYFRVQSGTDKMSNGSFDQVKWSPVISYSDKAENIDANGYKTNVFKASEADLISMDAHNNISAAASVKVSGNFNKPITSDNIILKAILSNDSYIEGSDGKGIPNPAYQEITVYEKEFAWDEVHNGDLSFNVPNNINGENLQLFILTESNVAAEQIKWMPTIEATENSSTLKTNAVVKYTYYSDYLSLGQPYDLTQDASLKVTPLFSTLTGTINTDINGEVLMTIKNTTGLLEKTKIKVVNGIMSPATVNIADVKSGKIWIEYYFEKTDFKNTLGTLQASVLASKGSFVDNKTINTNSFAHKEDARFGTLYRGWGQFVYNAAEGRYSNSIDESQLKLPENENEEIDPLTQTLALMIPDQTNLYWLGQDPNSFINGELMSSSRLGEQDVVLTNPLAGLSGNGGVSGGCIQGSGQVAISLKSKGDSDAVSGGVSGGIPSVGGSGSLNTASGKEIVETAYMDMNGDGYPDIITKNQIQVTNSRGGFDGEIISGSFASSSKSSNKSIALGSTVQHAFKTDNTSQNPSSINRMLKSIKASEANVNATAGGDYNKNNSYTQYALIDVNGDGLPDKVFSDNKVQLNLGYGFTEILDWGIDKIDDNDSYSVGLSGGIGAGLGFNKWSGSFAGGFGLNTAHNSTNFQLMDVNSDGLPDKVSKSGNTIYVSLNTGNGFASPIAWQGMSEIGKSASTSESANAAFTMAIPIPLSFGTLSIKINPGYNHSTSMSRITLAVRDVDGDGFPEIVESDEEGKMTVYRSTIARTNKLKTVSNPLGGSFTVDYDRSQATYDHPGGKWVMTSVEVNDGIHDDGANMKSIFDYENGRHERHEREFLGFGRVVTKNIDTESSETDKVYRKAIQECDVNSVYTAGNQVRSVVKDAADKKFTESVNEYHSYKVKASADNYTYTADASICSDRAIAFTPMKYTKTVVYEGETDGMIANESFYEYYLDGNFGDLKSYVYSDKGNLGNTGTGAFNYKTAIEYTHNKAKHILGLPSKVQVLGSDGNLYRQTEATYDTNYANHLTKVTQTLDATNKAIVDITYDKAGNIKQKTMPANSKGQRMWYKYLYDRDYNMYVERVEDAFGYRSEMEDYDYRYGIPLTTRDMNGYTLESTIDHLGRVETITGPNEQVLGLPYTIKFEYKPEIVKDASGIRNLAYAVTKHYDPQNPTDDLETVTFVDGFGRPIQVKKDGVITTTDATGSNPQDKKVMLVSGRAKFDPFGRAREAFYPVSEDIGTKTTFNPIFDAIAPTKTEYDIMDRALATTLPDNAKSTMAYTKDAGNRTLVTTVTDAMGGKQSTFTNGTGLTLKTEQYSGPDGTISTEFFFDPINQMLKVVDHGGNETLSTYDMAGRRTEVTHPASGTTTIKYDNASNMLSRQTANLGEEGKEITYDYDFNRLLAISYPNHPENNVKYSYGNKNAAHNRVGRLMLQEDATGAQEFFYGRLGEMNKVRRTVIIPNQAIATYVTEWKYDSWNRLEEMIYPDLEKITYSYNTGGQLEAVKGEKAYSYNYVNKIGYDKFEQRTYLKYCNGAETNYNYDPERRRLDNLQVWAGKDSHKQIMNNSYQFDKVDNVLSVVNTAPRPTAGMGGQMTHTYTYDGLYRLATATGGYEGADSKTANYTLAMGYDNLHNITSKKQDIQQAGIMFDGVLKAGYELDYTYSADKPHQIATIKDDNYRTEDSAADDMIRNEHAYQYDANGNLIYINTSREKEDGANDRGAKERKMLWDEENRLGAINVNGFISGYWYDAGGERVIKASGDDEGIYVNDVFSGARTETNNFTAYINPYLVVSKGGQYTKHIYIGSQRIVSKLGDLESYGQDPRRIEYAGAGVDGAKVDYAAKYKQSQQTIKDNYAYFEVDYNGTDNDDYVNGGGFCCDDTPKMRSFIPNQNDNPELFQYYYHADHLGSSSLITNLDGEVVQHIEYVPFGEVFIEERNNKWNTPYLFNAKELDEETGLYYYGARYYDSRASVWLSTDLLQEKKPNISPYAYCAVNPIKFVDPDGRDEYEFEKNKDGVYTYNKTINKYDGEHYGIFKDTGEKFSFADPINDPKSIEDGDISQLYFPSEYEMVKDISNSGAYKEENQGLISGYEFLENNSHASFDTGTLDYTINSEMHGNNGIMPIGLIHGYLYLVKDESGSYTGHNDYNFGNFLWGATAQAVGVHILPARAGAHYNNFRTDPGNYDIPWWKFWKLTPDSSDDQFSIKKGWAWHRNCLTGNCK